VSAAPPQQSRNRGGAGQCRGCPPTVIIPHIGSTPTRVGELHRWAEATWAIADTLEASQAPGADVAAGAAIVVVAAGRDARAVAVHLTFAAAEPAGTPTDAFEARLAGGADITAGSTVAVVAARIDADTAAVALTLTAAITTRSADATAADAADAGLLTGSAVFGIGGEVAAAVDSAAILHADGAVCALADPAPAFDRDESALAQLAARSTVVQIGLEIDADASAVG
jgi:hypothetical protein